MVNRSHAAADGTTGPDGRRQLGWRTCTTPGKGSVSLRANATFADGGAVDNTVIRAYQLR